MTFSFRFFSLIKKIRNMFNVYNKDSCSIYCLRWRPLLDVVFFFTSNSCNFLLTFGKKKKKNPRPLGFSTDARSLLYAQTVKDCLAGIVQYHWKHCLDSMCIKSYGQTVCISTATTQVFTVCFFFLQQLFSLREGGRK